MYKIKKVYYVIRYEYDKNKINFKYHRKAHYLDFMLEILVNLIYIHCILCIIIIRKRIHNMMLIYTLHYVEIEREHI